MFDFYFVGMYECTLTRDGRFVMPNKIREQLENTKSPDTLQLYCDESDGHLYLYPDESRPTLDEERLVYPDLYQSAIPQIYSAHIDKQRRVLIPKVCRKWAGLNDKILICGLLYKIKITRLVDYQYDDGDIVSFPEGSSSPRLVKLPL